LTLNRQAKRGDFTASCAVYPRPEKPNACAKPPKPPRVTPLEPESEELADDECPDEESPPKKLNPDEPREPPPPDEPRDDEQGVVVCGTAGAAIPGGGVWGDAGPQPSRGISA